MRSASAPPEQAAPPGLAQGLEHVGGPFAHARPDPRERQAATSSADVDVGGRVREGPDRDAVHAGLGDRPDVLERDASRGLEQRPLAEARGEGGELRDAAVVEEQRVRAGGERLLGGGLGLDLHLEPEVRGRGGARRLHRGADPARGGDVVVLDEERVVEPRAVVHAAARPRPRTCRARASPERSSACRRWRRPCRRRRRRSGACAVATAADAGERRSAPCARRRGSRGPSPARPTTEVPAASPLAVRDERRDLDPAERLEHCGHHVLARIRRALSRASIRPRCARRRAGRPGW